MVHGLGLSNSSLLDVIKNTNVVINSGALVKHSGKKEELENTNVIGAENVIKFCMAYGKRLMHISTLDISGNMSSNIFTENNLYVGQDLEDSYALSKFKAEVKVLNAVYDGLDAQVLRLGNITSRYSDGNFRSSLNDNSFANKIKSFIEIGAFPKNDLNKGVEFTPVDLASNAVISILNHKSDCNMFHIMESNLVSTSLAIKTYNKLGIDMVPVSDKLMTDIINGILSDSKRKHIVDNMNKNYISFSNTKLSCNFTEDYLKNCRFPLEKT